MPSSLQKILTAIATAKGKIDIISTNAAKIKIELTKRKNNNDELKKLLDRMALPAYLLREGYKTSVSFPEKPLSDLIEDIKTVLNGVLWSDIALRSSLRGFFEKILHEYEYALDAFQGGDEAAKQTMLVPPGRFTAEVLDGVFYLLPRDLALEMVCRDETGISVKKIAEGNNPVAAISGPEGGIHAKPAPVGGLNKLFPAAEAASGALGESVVDASVSAATTIGKVWVDIKTSKGFETIERVVQIGETIHGELVKTYFELPIKYRWLRERINQQSNFVDWLPCLMNGTFLQHFLINNPQYQNLSDEQLLFSFLQLIPKTQASAPVFQQDRLIDFASLDLAEILECGTTIPSHVVTQFQQLLDSDRENITIALALFCQSPQLMQGVSLREVCSSIKLIRTLTPELLKSWEGIYSKISLQQLQWLQDRAGTDYLHSWIAYLAGDEPKKYLKHNGYKDEFTAQQLLLAFLNINYKTPAVLSGAEYRFTNFLQPTISPLGVEWVSKDDLYNFQAVLALAGKEKVLFALAMCSTWPTLQHGIALSDLIKNMSVFSAIKRIFPTFDAPTIDSIILSDQFLAIHDSKQPNPDSRIPKFDRETLSQMTIRAIICKPEDQKTDNDLAIMSAGILYDRIIDGDRELAFEGNYLLIKTYLFFMSLMEQPIHPNVAASYIKRFPATRILDFLDKTLCRIKRYDGMMLSGSLAEADLKDIESGIKILDIPFRLDPTAIPTAYQTLRLLYDALRKNEHLTHWELLRTAMPLIAQVYLTVTIWHIPSAVIFQYFPAQTIVDALRSSEFLTKQFPGVPENQLAAAIESIASSSEQANKKKFNLIISQFDLWELYNHLGPAVIYQHTNPQELIKWFYYNKMERMEDILAGQLNRILPGTQKTVAQALAEKKRKDDYEDSRTQDPKDTTLAFIEQLFSSTLSETEFWDVLNRLGAEAFDFVKKLPPVFQVISKDANKIIHYTLQDVYDHAIWYKQAGAVAALIRCHGNNGLDVYRLKTKDPNGCDITPLALALRPESQDLEVLKVLLTLANVKKSDAMLFSIIPWQEPTLRKKIKTIEEVLRVLAEGGFDLDARDTGATKSTLLELTVKYNQPELFVTLVNLGATAIITNIDALIKFVSANTSNSSVQAAFDKLLQRNRFISRHFYQQVAQSSLQGKNIVASTKLGNGREAMYVKPFTPSDVMEIASESLRAILFPRQLMGIEWELHKLKDSQQAVAFAPQVSGNTNWLSTPALDSHIDSANFTCLMLMALATLPNNADENSFVACSKVGESGTRVTELVRTGSENPFVSQLVVMAKDKNGGEQIAQVKLRTVIFCLNSMQLPLSKPIIEDFIGSGILKRIQDWLEYLGRWEKRHGIPVSFSTGGTVANLYKRLVKMQRVARRKSTISGLELLQILPEAFNAYDALFRTYESEDKRAEQLFSENLTQDKVARKASISASTLEMEKKGLEATQQLFEQVDKVKNDIYGANTATLRTIKEVEQIEQLLENLSFRKLKEEIQKDIFKQIAKLNLSFRTLIIPFAKIDTKTLQKILEKSPELMQLDISECKNVNNDIFATITKHCPKLMELTANRVGWQEISPIENETTIVFRNLRTLQLNGCEQLASVSGVVAPQLRTLTINGALKLVKLGIQSFMLNSVELNNTPQLSKAEIINLVAQSSYLAKRGGITGSSYNSKYLDVRQLIAMYVALGLPLRATLTRNFFVSTGSVLDLSGLSVTNDDVTFLIALVKERRVTIDVTGCPFVTPALFKDIKNITLQQQINYTSLAVAPSAKMHPIAHQNSTFDFIRKMVFVSNGNGVITKFSLPDFQELLTFRTEKKRWNGMPEKMITLLNGDLVVGTSDGNLEVWDVGGDEVKCRKVIKAHDKKVTSLIYSPRANVIISASLGQDIRFTTWPDLQWLGSWSKLNYEVTAMALLPPEPEQNLNQQDFVVGTSDGRLIVFSVSSNNPTKIEQSSTQLGGKTEVRCITNLSFDDQAIVAVCANTNITIVNLDADPEKNEKEEIVVLEDDAIVHQAASLGDGYIVTGNRNGQVELWNWKHQAAPHVSTVFEGKSNKQINCLVLDERRLLIGTSASMNSVELPSWEKKIALPWHASTGGPLSYPVNSSSGSLSSPSGSPHGSPKNSRDSSSSALTSSEEELLTLTPT